MSKLTRPNARHYIAMVTDPHLLPGDEVIFFVRASSSQSARQKIISYYKRNFTEQTDNLSIRLVCARKNVDIQLIGHTATNSVVIKEDLMNEDIIPAWLIADEGGTDE
jgi:hypothetical protein